MSSLIQFFQPQSGIEKMYFATQFVTLIVAGLGLVSSTAAAPVQNTTSHELVARGPYDTHNGWVCNCF
jgi:hypothetical protein